MREQTGLTDRETDRQGKTDKVERTNRLTDRETDRQGKTEE